MDSKICKKNKRENDIREQLSMKHNLISVQ